MNELDTAILALELLWGVFMMLAGFAAIAAGYQLKENLLDRDNKVFFGMLFALIGVTAFLTGLYNVVIVQAAPTYVLYQQTRILETIR